MGAEEEKSLFSDAASSPARSGGSEVSMQVVPAGGSDGGRGRDRGAEKRVAAPVLAVAASNVAADELLDGLLRAGVRVIECVSGRVCETVLYWRQSCEACSKGVQTPRLPKHNLGPWPSVWQDHWVPQAVGPIEFGYRGGVGQPQSQA